MEADVRQREPAPRSQLDGIIGVLVDGNEEERARLLHLIQRSELIDRLALADRLRAEIRERFSPRNEADFSSAIRDPKKIPSIRSWLLSSLIWCGAEEPASQEIILQHLLQDFEPDRHVRFWTLAELYLRKASYLGSAIRVGLSDRAPEVSALAQAASSPESPELISQFREMLQSRELETVWQVLRLLRVVPITPLTGDVCSLLEHSAAGSPIAYDALYALSHPSMARHAVKLLSERPGVDGVVARVIIEANGSDRNAARNFTVLLAAFDRAAVERALAEAERAHDTREVARLLRGYFEEHLAQGADNGLFIAGYVSDTIDVKKDRLDIEEDVQTLTAVMLAKDVRPPLAIGLFGGWGSGKSFFMKSMRAAAGDLAKQAESSGDSKFCSNIVTIEFNAWHYVDTNLWATLASYILHELDAHVTPKQTAEQEQEALRSKLNEEKALAEKAEADRQNVQAQIAEQESRLQALQREREQRDVELRDLRASDLRKLLSKNTTLESDLKASLEGVGAPAALSSIADLSQVVREAYTLRGRVAALVVALFKSRNIKIFLPLLLVVLVVIPWLAEKIRELINSDEFVVRASAIVSQIIAIAGGLAVALRTAIKQVTTNLAKVEDAKRQVDELVADKRQAPSQEEVKLGKKVALLKTREQDVESRVKDSTAKVLDLEKTIGLAKEKRSLAHFLTERTRSEDYRQHLGLIATIRQDFESLGARLASAPAGSSGSRPVDRIILFIDDLDRCPEDKVMDVLQAVHLLLAYPLFVVVVGVDPCWLLHSLETTHSSFRRDEGSAGHTNLWRTTPQVYLEKIFQIPFSVRPMTTAGYASLMNGLLSPVVRSERPEHRSRQAPLSLPQAEGGGALPHEAGAPADPVDAPAADPHAADPEPVDDPKFTIHEDALVITTWEAAFAERLFALIPTPRAAKRFSNIYRILKAPVRREHLAEFEGTPEVPGEFQVPMLLLAILLGAPTEATSLFPRLHLHVGSGRAARHALERFTTLELESPGFESLEEKIRPIVSDGRFPNTPRVFLEWLPRVSRFSFEALRAVQWSPQPELPAREA